MSITLTKRNAMYKLKRVYHEIFEISWNCGEFNSYLLNNFPNLKLLICHNKCVTNLDAVSKLTKLQELRCDRNKIHDIKGIANTTSLECLFLGENQIHSLNAISKLINLKKLYCNK